MWETHLITIHVVMVGALVVVVVTIIHVHMRLVVRTLWHVAHTVLVYVWTKPLRDAIGFTIFASIKIIFGFDWLLFHEL